MKHSYKHLALGILAALCMQACTKSENLTLSAAHTSLPLAVTGDTIRGTVKGVLQPNTIYYMPADVFVNKGDTLYIPAGVKIIILGDGTAQKSPSFFINGTLISMGTKDAPNWFTVPDDQKQLLPGGGVWGGVVGDSAQNIIVKWTHVEYTGAPWGTFQTASATISPTHYGFVTLSATNFILEDSWISHTQDDGCYLRNAKVNIVGNTFESIGTTKGCGLNIKYGTRGDIAYNVVINIWNSGIKSQSLSGAPSQSIINVYNNTVINSGFFNPSYTLGGGISFEKLVAGTAYNNIIVNNKIGLRILSGSSAVDVSNFRYGYNLFYGTDTSLTHNFYPPASGGFAGTPQTGDILSATVAGANDPMFVGLIAPNITPTYPQVYQGIDLHLQSASPAIGKGLTPIQGIPMNTASATFTARIVPPNKDMGAYPTDGSGNQH